MFKAVILFCLVASTMAGTVRPRFGVAKRMRNGRIIGGTNANIEDYPWQISLQYFGSHNCGGSIISSNWVLTAAHCLYGFTVNSLSVRSGTSTSGSGGAVSDISTGYYHAQYDDEVYDYDIGAVQVSTPFVFSTTTQAVTLPASGTDPSGGTTVTVTGWGYLETGGTTPVNLQQITTSVIDRNQCNSLYAGINTVTARMICAGNLSTTNGGVVCSGDSGGPLVSGSTQLGIVSWAVEICEAYPSVFSNVGNLRDWITDATGV